MSSEMDLVKNIAGEAKSKLPGGGKDRYLRIAFRTGTNEERWLRVEDGPSVRIQRSSQKGGKRE
jgi:hypothetical protein